MAYLLENDTKNIVDDIIKRKEFYKYKILSPHKEDQSKIKIIPRFFIDKMISDGNYLQLSSYQNFTKNYINPHTIYSRLMLKWETGVGKTIGSLSIAMNFIKYYNKETLNGSNGIGSVFIIGFTSAIFKTELLRFPEFGFISREELNKLKLLRKLSYSGSKSDLENLQEFLMRIKKRFSNRENNGFFEFIGYKKLSNMIFIKNDPSINISELDENGIRDAIQEKKIKLNITLLDTFKNSLIICDEIHNTYNSLEKNNWGVSIQYILNYHPSVRALFLSATPINNNPTEIIDLLNLLLPKTFYPDRINKIDFFTADKQLKPGALDKIANLSKGRFSYLRDNNPKFFPKKTFVGETIKGAPYIKFIRCPMSKFHYNTYKKVYTGSLSADSQYLVDFAIPNPSDDNIGLYQTNLIKSEIQYAPQSWKDINKINFINEKIVGDILQIKNLSKISTKFVEMCKTVINNIKNQSGKMFIYHNIIHMSGVLFIQEILLQNNIIGEFDNSSADTLCVICGDHKKNHKTNQLGGNSDFNTVIKSHVSDEYDIITKYNGNTLFYEVFLNNKLIPILEYKKYDDIILIPSVYVDYNSSDKDINNVIENIYKEYKNIIIEDNQINNKLKSIIKKLKCDILTRDKTGKILYYNTPDIKLCKSDVSKVINQFQKYKRGGNLNANHSFIPVRFISIHGNIDKVNMYSSIEKYNSPDNTNGERIMILIGGKIIKEAFDLKSVREMMIMGRPDNIPTLIQIMGRAVRKGSHVLLPNDKRNVNIRIFTTCLPEKKNGEYIISYEEEKYIEKLQHYQIIQNIEKTIHENAIDAVINQDIIWPDSDKAFYKKNPNHKEIGSLYFEPNVSNKSNKQFKLNELNLETFNAFHSDDEIYQIMIIIKRLFLEKSTVWIYNDLLYAVHNCNEYFTVEFNPQLIDENLFIVALTRLLWINDENFIEPFIKYNNKGLMNTINKLYDTDDKIIILPGGQVSVINQIGPYYILFPVDTVSNMPIIDTELQYRILKIPTKVHIDIKQFLESGKSIVDFSNKRDRFFTKWNNVPINRLELAVCDFGTEFHILFLEECIKYIFDVWTDADVKKSAMHSFYFKMLSYYDLRNLVVWGHTAKPFIYNKYSKYVNPVNVKLQSNKLKLHELQVDKNDQSSNLINLLNSSINKSDIKWISSGLSKKFEDDLDASLKLFDGNYKKKNLKNKKIDADLVPIGHFLNYIPKFYIPISGWFDSPEYLENSDIFSENSLIIGYDERSKTGVHIRFKLRNPIQNIKQFKDTRLIERGIVCSSKSKHFLIEISKKLDIKIKGKLNIETLCSDIRTKLIYLEIKERVAKTNRKWFYFIYENRPETILT